MTLTKKMWIALGALAVLSPLGVFLPDHFKAGAAWGEWGSKELSHLVGYVPRGLHNLGEFWKAPMPDYTFQGWEEKGLTHLSFAYILSAIVGIVVVGLIVFLIGKTLAGKNE